MGAGGRRFTPTWWTGWHQISARGAAGRGARPAGRYYRLGIRQVRPQSCEQRIEVELADGTLLRGFVDRIDVAGTGERGSSTTRPAAPLPRSPRAGRVQALFQMKFYAVALLRSRDVLATRLRLIYLADGQLLDYTPTSTELLRFEKTLMAIWRPSNPPAPAAIPATTVAAVGWCSHQAPCPVYGWHTAALPRLVRAAARTRGMSASAQ